MKTVQIYRLVDRAFAEVLQCTRSTFIFIIFLLYCKYMSGKRAKKLRRESVISGVKNGMFFETNMEGLTDEDHAFFQQMFREHDEYEYGVPRPEMVPRVYTEEDEKWLRPVLMV